MILVARHMLFVWVSLTDILNRYFIVIELTKKPPSDTFFLLIPIKCKFLVDSIIISQFQNRDLNEFLVSIFNSALIVLEHSFTIDNCYCEEFKSNLKYLVNTYSNYYQSNDNLCLNNRTIRI